MGKLSLLRTVHLGDSTLDHHSRSTYRTTAMTWEDSVGLPRPLIHIQRV